MRDARCQYDASTRYMIVSTAVYETARETLAVTKHLLLLQRSLAVPCSEFKVFYAIHIGLKSIVFRIAKKIQKVIWNIGCCSGSRAATCLWRLLHIYIGECHRPKVTPSCLICWLCDFSLLTICISLDHEEELSELALSHSRIDLDQITHFYPGATALHSTELTLQHHVDRALGTLRRTLPFSAAVSLH